MAELDKPESVDYNDLELEVKQLKVSDGTNTAIVLKSGVASALTNDTIGTDAEDGYVVVEIGGTAYKIPVWLDD